MPHFSIISVVLDHSKQTICSHGKQIYTGSKCAPTQSTHGPYYGNTVSISKKSDFPKDCFLKDILAPLEEGKDEKNQLTC